MEKNSAAENRGGNRVNQGRNGRTDCALRSMTRRLIGIRRESPMQISVPHRSKKCPIAPIAERTSSSLNKPELARAFQEVPIAKSAGWAVNTGWPAGMVNGAQR